jgi:hypothetical protein
MVGMTSVCTESGVLSERKRSLVPHSEHDPFDETPAQLGEHVRDLPWKEVLASPIPLSQLCRSPIPLSSPLTHPLK